MTDILIRSAVAPLEVKGDGRTVLGMIAPYGKVATVDDGFGMFRESIDRGAFAKVMRARPQQIRLHLEHDGPWIGRGESWIDTPDGLSMAMRLDDTEGGRTAAYKLRDGQVPGLSIAFLPGRTRTKMHDDGPVEHRETIKALHHVALCPIGAYKGAEVTAVRSAIRETPERLARWQEWIRQNL